ncbi:MAG: endonuclease domain-containing protein [Legionellales bacterium]
MYYLPYNKDLKEFSRFLRNNSTLSEVLLWNRIKGKSIMGYQFNRQKPIDRYIVDFYCKELSLVIEIDGASHQHPEASLNDQKRQAILEELKLKFIRFDDIDVKRNMENVIRSIESFIIEFEKNRK